MPMSLVVLPVAAVDAPVIEAHNANTLSLFSTLFTLIMSLVQSRTEVALDDLLTSRDCCEHKVKDVLVEVNTYPNFLSVSYVVS